MTELDVKSVNMCNLWVLISPLLYNLYSLAPEDEHIYREVLSNQYAQIFLQDIYRNTLKIDQISALNENIKALPDHEYARIFLEKVTRFADPYLKAVLGEKIQTL